MRILLADDHKLVRDAIAGFIRTMTGFLADVVHDLPAALNMVRTKGVFDLVLLDYQMPGMGGLQGLTDMLTHQQGRPVALISGNMPPTAIEEAFQSGASGYLPKTMGAQSLILALRLILAGEKYAPPDIILAAGAGQPCTALPTLTQRETVVLRHVCEGMTNVQVAAMLGLHETTIKVHVKSICTKLDARNRTQATIIAKDAGFH